MKIIAINGNALAGKDTFVEKVSHYNRVVGISTIDPVKKYYESIGWDGIKTSQDRKVLNILKRLWILGDIRIEDCRSPNEWVVRQCLKFEREGMHAVFVMVREFSEMTEIKEIGDTGFAGGVTLRIARDGLLIPPVELDFINSHPEGYLYDFTIINSTTDDENIPELENAASSFIKEVIVHKEGSHIMWNGVTYGKNKFNFQVF